MKKSLLALAVLGAFAGAASAQSSVTVYGIVDIGVSSIDDGANSTAGMTSGNNSASRIGFKGVEDLGNGLKAEFVLENGFVANNGDSATVSGVENAGKSFSRLSYLGLGGNFGTVRLGRQNSPTKTALDVIDPFKNGGMAGSIAVFGNDSIPERVSNQLTYISNNFGGFQGSVAYAAGNVEGLTSANHGTAAQLGYTNGPLELQLAYSNFSDTNDTVGVFPTTEDENTENLFFGGAYNFGVVKLHGGWGQWKTEDNIANTEEKGDSYLLGLTVPFGANAVRASYVYNDPKADDSSTSFYALSYTYAMSKRTTLYTTYTHTDNDAGASLNGVGAGLNGDSFAVGVQHNF